MLKTLVHFLLKHFSREKHRSFLASRDSLHQTQSQILQNILQTLSKTEIYGPRLSRGDFSYTYFQRHFPLTCYSDYESAIEEQKNVLRPILSPVPQRYQPTSGSTSQRKWIPYTHGFLKEIDQASLVWLHDLYLQYPKIRKGSHYWSLSWLPTELRHKVNNSDLEYLNRISKTLLSQVMAAPNDLQNAPTLSSSFFATLCWLASREDLSFVFVWSPTFFLSLLREMELHREKIVATLESGSWADHQEELKKFKPPRSKTQAERLKNVEFKNGWPHLLWPDLFVLSCWTSADSARWIEKIQDLCPQLDIQGKGLFATEGVVTIPVAGELHLSYQSHFYEFILPDDSIKRAHELKVGERVRPLLTSSNGFVRYDLGDELLVSKMQGECPILEFLGRSGAVDLVGEKLSFTSLKSIIHDLENEFSLSPLGFLAGVEKSSGLAHYCLVIEGASKGVTSEILEHKLNRHHHYALARDLKQLGPSQILVTSCGLHFFEKLIASNGWNKGDIKWETVLKVPYLPEVNV